MTLRVNSRALVVSGWEARDVVASAGQLCGDVLVRVDVPVQPLVRSWSNLRLLPGNSRVQHPRGSRGRHGHRRCKVAIIADTPKVMTEGNWRVGVFVGEDASDAQFEQLVRVFSGQLGGPMAGLAPLIGELLGAERAAIEINDDGLRHAVRVGDEIDFEIEDIVPFGVETGEPVRFAGMFHPVGSDLTMAEAKRSRINAFGIQYEGKTGLSKSDFSWAA